MAPHVGARPISPRSACSARARTATARRSSSSSRRTGRRRESAASTGCGRRSRSHSSSRTRSTSSTSFGFKSSNAALLVEPDARAALHGLPLRGGRTRGRRRRLRGDASARCSGISPSACRARSASRPTTSPTRATRRWAPGRIEPVPRRGLVERLRAVKDEQELAAIRRACEITDRMFERLAEERFIGRRERDVAWTIEQLFHDEGADAGRLREHRRRPGRTPRGRTRARRDREIRAGETVVIDTGCIVDGYTLGLHAHVRHRARSTAS